MTRNVYIVTAMRYDADDGWVLCRLDGSDAQHCGDECAVTLDVLFDLHPEVFAAWEKSSRRCGCFDLCLEDELGTGWRDLDFIQASFEVV